MIDLNQGEDSAAFYQVTLRTINNWRKWGPPHSVQILLTMAEGTHPDWLGIRFGTGAIVLPDGQRVIANELLWGPYWQREALESGARADALLARLKRSQRVTQAINEASNFDSIAQKIHRG